MIVTCTNCETSFQLDESRVPEQGIRVRCSRCKEAFFLKHPSATAAEAVNQVAQQAIEEGMAGPGTTHDLPGRPEINNEDENDWEFNVDPHREVDDGSAAARAPVDVPESILDEASVGLDVDDLEDANAGPKAGGDAGEDVEIDPSVLGSIDLSSGGEEESDFGSVDDFSAMMQDRDAQEGVDLGVGADVGSGTGGDDPLADTTTSASTGHAGTYSGGGTSDDLGDPENWDLLNDHNAGESGGADSSALLGRISLTTLSGNKTGVGNSALDAIADGWSDELYGPESAGPSRMMQLVAYVGHSAGWLVAAALAGVVLFGGSQTSARVLVEATHSEVLGRGVADALRVERVQASSGERLLVVSGSLRNPTPGRIDLGGPVAVSLLDPTGRRIEGARTQAGTPLTDLALRELSAPDRIAAQDRASRQLVTRALPPRSEQPFQAVLPDVWPLAARFVVEIGDVTTPAGIPLDDAQAGEDAEVIEDADIVPEAPAEVTAGVEAQAIPPAAAPPEAPSDAGLDRY